MWLTVGMQTPYLTAFLALAPTCGCIPATMTEIPAVTGRVVGLDDRPLPGARVEMSRKPDTGGPPFDIILMSDADGRFKYEGRGRLILWCPMADRLRETVQVQASAAGGNSLPQEFTYLTEVRFLKEAWVHEIGDVHVLILGTPP
jgi:hypothetical protein